MKANELMIGDWVYVPMAKHIAKVDSILSKKEAHNDACVVIDFCGQGFLAHYTEEDLSPIPLTAEILEKNGCTMVDKGDYGEWHIKENPNIPLWQHTEFIIFGGIEIHFVHEFQHALRLCGLNDLADNFTV